MRYATCTACNLPVNTRRMHLAGSPRGWVAPLAQQPAWPSSLLAAMQLFNKSVELNPTNK